MALKFDMNPDLGQYGPNPWEDVSDDMTDMAQVAGQAFAGQMETGGFGRKGSQYRKYLRDFKSPEGKTESPLSFDDWKAEGLYKKGPLQQALADRRANRFQRLKEKNPEAFEEWQQSYRDWEEAQGDEGGVGTESPGSFESYLKSQKPSPLENLLGRGKDFLAGSAKFGQNVLNKVTLGDGFDTVEDQKFKPFQQVAGGVQNILQSIKDKRADKQAYKEQLELSESPYQLDYQDTDVSTPDYINIQRQVDKDNIAAQQDVTDYSRDLPAEALNPPEPPQPQITEDWDYVPEFDDEWNNPAKQRGLLGRLFGGFRG